MAKSRLLQPLPWYQWNPGQWQGSRKVQRMSWAARGLYRELMDECWIKGSVPATVSGIADFFEVDEDEIAPLLPQIIRCFDVLPDGSMSSPFIEEIRTEAYSRRIIQAERRLGKDKHGNPRLTTVSESDPRLTAPNQSEVVEDSREEKRKEVHPPTPRKRGKSEVVLGDYSTEFEQACSTWGSLFTETRRLKDSIPADKIHVAARPGSKAASWEVWKRLLTCRVNGSGLVQGPDLLEVVQGFAAAKLQKAKDGVELNLPMLPTLLNKPEILDAVVHVVHKRTHPSEVSA